jgi:DNA-binding transcriptional MerR regulator/methylmalonyl-CoA mutase cobalamin-binding subunit
MDIKLVSYMVENSGYLQPRHPIRVVAARTGLSLDVLRVWERRYGAVSPTRTKGGQRLYSDADIERLGVLKRATEAGRGISQVAALPHEELARLVAQDEAAAAGAERRSERRPGGEEPPSTRYVSKALAAVAELDPIALDGVLRQATFALGARLFVGGVLTPVLEQIGSRWRAGDLMPAHEHAASVVIRRLIDWIGLDADPGGAAPRIVIATPAEEQHEFGAMLAGASARGVGWQVTYLGRDLPVDDIAVAARQTKADCVALSLVYPAAAGQFITSLPLLRRQLGEDMPILVGGAAAVRLAPELETYGARVMPDLYTFAAALEELKGRGLRGDPVRPSPIEA